MRVPAGRRQSVRVGSSVRPSDMNRLSGVRVTATQYKKPELVEAPPPKLDLGVLKPRRTK